MKVKKEIQEFYKKNEKMAILDATHRLDFEEIGNYILFSVVSSNNFNNKFENVERFPLVLTDKNLEVKFLKRINYWKNRECMYYLVDKEQSAEIDEVSTGVESFMRNKVYDILKEVLPALNPEIIKNMDESDYMDYAINEYKNKHELKYPLSSSSVQLTPEIVIMCLENDPKLKDKALMALSDTSIESYETYICRTECQRRYLERLEKNPKTKQLSDLISAIEEDKKSFTIHYHDLAGKQLKDTFKKNISNMDKINKTILTYEVFNKIPVELIDKITWRSDVLYDANNYSNSEIDKVNTGVKCCLLDNKNLVPFDLKCNKDLAYKVLTLRPELIKTWPREITLDADFMLKVLSNIPEKNYENEKMTCDCLNIRLWEIKDRRYDHAFTNLDASIIENKYFLTKFLEQIPESDYNSFNLDGEYVDKLLNASKKHVSSYEFCKLLLNKFGNTTKVTDIIPESFINRQETLDILKNGQTRHNVLSKLCSIEKIEYLYDTNFINENIKDIEDANILKDRNFILRHISEKMLESPKIMSMYKNDKDIMDKIFTSVTSRSATENYLNVFGISRFDSASVFELVSKNINFFHLLSRDDEQIFFAGELDDINNVKVYPNRISINTSNFTFNIFSNEVQIKATFNPSVVYSLSTGNSWFSNSLSEDAKELFASKLKEYFHLRSSKYDSVFNETINEHQEKAIEEER